MKCRSVVGIWPETPPSHKVTASATLDDPPTLYTGAADGSVVWWHLSDSLSSKKIKPVAMLCGHTAPIVDLCICYPLLAPQKEGNTDYHREIPANSDPNDRGALLSACSDGVLCVWSRGSGHCRRRRKLPPWIGSPSVVRTLPVNRRYVCVASCSTDVAHSSDGDLTETTEGAEVTGDQESFGRRPPKCMIVIVDSYTLTIVETVFHGHLTIGPLKFMALFEDGHEKQKHVAVVVDSHGKFQCIPLAKDMEGDEDVKNNLHEKSPAVSRTTFVNGSYEGGSVVSVAVHGKILGLVYRTHCIFMLVDNATIIGEISFENSLLCSRSDRTPSHIAGGIFISSHNVCTSQPAKLDSTIHGKFAVWNGLGFGVIYEIRFVDDTFSYEAIYEIPAISCHMDVRFSTNFVQLSEYFLRVESMCLHDEEPFLWKPYITIWSLHQQLGDQSDFGRTCRLLGEGDFVVDWVVGSSCTVEPEPPEHPSNEEPAASEAAVGLRDMIPGQQVNGTFCKDDLECSFVQKGRIVSSTMILSLSDLIPYAVVYGYHNGEIELVQFKMLRQEVESDDVNLHPETETQGAKQIFSGHNDAVLCLAAHQMVGASAERTFSQVLLSGSKDCTVRVWNIQTCNPIMVMHHHVAPVRQLILPPLQSDRPWSDCFLTVGEDSCVSLVSLETLRVERMFPGHPSYPGKLVWDSVRGYLACLSQSYSVAKDVLYVWDIKAGSRERVLRGPAAHAMFSNFCKVMGKISGAASNCNTSGSSLLLPSMEDGVSLLSHRKSSQSTSSGEVNIMEHGVSSPNFWNKSSKPTMGNNHKVPIECSSTLSGIAILTFALSSIFRPDHVRNDGDKQANGTEKQQQTVITCSQQGALRSESSSLGTLLDPMERHHRVDTFALCLLRFSLSFLHFWGVDIELDHLLLMEMNIKRYKKLMLAPGLEGDRGSITLAFPSFSSILQLWKSSSEFCALRSLTMVSLSQIMVSLSHSCSGASSVLSAFYTRNFAEKVPGVKPPSLQLLASFWQDEDEHVRLAARSLFHCAASRAIPPPLHCPKTADVGETVCSVNQVGGKEFEYAEKHKMTGGCLNAEMPPEIDQASQKGDGDILKWLDSYELQDWISCVGGTSQDAMASHIIVAAALAIWYPSLVRPSLAVLVVHPLMKLVMAMNEKYSSTAAELLAEGMDSTWKSCIGSEISRLIGDIFFQIECVSGVSANTASVGLVVPLKIRETLVGVLLPSLALADIPGYLSVIEGLIWSTASDSPVHLVSLNTLMRLMRGSPRNLAQYLNKVVKFILQTMDPANSVMRKTCLQSSMTTLREVVRVYPMVALDDASSRLAVGDAIAEANNASIYVYDMQSVSKIKVLDASGPPGLPTLLSGAPETVIPAISALSFSPDGEGLVAFSEHGLTIRWWSLGTVWWEKLSRNLVPVQCTKLIFVPPWEGFFPNSSRASLMENIAGNVPRKSSQELTRSSDGDSLNLLLYNLDLSYQLEWIGGRKACLTRHGHELGTFLL